MSRGEPTSTVSAPIREQQHLTLKFRAESIDVLENNRRIEVITQAEARRRLAAGGYEAIGHGTVKYLRRLNGAPISEKTIYPWSGARKGNRFTEAESLPGRFRS